MATVYRRATLSSMRSLDLLLNPSTIHVSLTLLQVYLLYILYYLYHSKYDFCFILTNLILLQSGSQTNAFSIPLFVQHIFWN